METAWELGLARGLISSVTFDEAAGRLFIPATNRRIDVTSCRDALNGYQKSRCFYCFTPIFLGADSPLSADVDHFFPKLLGSDQLIRPIDGVWNLVLACQDCNRGKGGKFARVPALDLLERLWTRNEYFIGSHHPLRETLLSQTGTLERQRRDFLQAGFTAAKSQLVHIWKPQPRADATF